MLYRLLTATIVLFWMTMTALLVRKELGSEDNSLRAVPLAHVAKVMFAHGQPSDLQIYSDKATTGRLLIHPHSPTDDGQRRIDFSGTLHVQVPGMARERVTWTGGLDLGNAMELERIKVGLSFRSPEADAVDLLVEPAANRVTYETRTGNRSLKRTYSFDEKGVDDWLRDQGLDPAVLTSLRNPRSAAMVFKARQSSLAIHGEKVETYLISAEQGEQTLIEAHVSQLGQILRVRTLLGYSAAPEELTP